MNIDPVMVNIFMPTTETTSMDSKEIRIMEEDVVENESTNQHVECVVSMVTLLSFVTIDLTNNFQVL